MLVQAVEYAADRGLYEHAWRIAHASAVFFQIRAADWDEWRHTHLRALEAVRTAGCRTGELALRRGLGR